MEGIMCLSMRSVVNLKRLFYLSTNVYGFIPKYINMINYKVYVFPLSDVSLFLAYSFHKASVLY